MNKLESRCESENLQVIDCCTSSFIHLVNSVLETFVQLHDLWSHRWNDLAAGEGTKSGVAIDNLSQL